MGKIIGELLSEQKRCSELKHLSVLIKPTSGLCNIRCAYCFYANVTSLREVESYGRMKKDVAEKNDCSDFY